MKLSPELDSRIVRVDGWSPREEKIIRDIMAKERVVRIEAIRRMRHRRLDDLRGRTLTVAQVEALRRLHAEGRALTLALVRDVCGWSQTPMTSMSTPKGGRPLKYRTDSERQKANARYQRNFRQRQTVQDVRKTPSQALDSRGAVSPILRGYVG